MTPAEIAALLRESAKRHERHLMEYGPNPMGVIPDSAKGLVTFYDLEAAEHRRRRDVFDAKIKKLKDDDLAAAEKRRTLDPDHSPPQ